MIGIAPYRLLVDHPYWTRQVRVEPLVTLRVVLGLLVAYGALRFMAEGWIEELIIEPRHVFQYYGFDWIPRPNLQAAYALYSVIVLSAAGVALGWRYKLTSKALFVSFTLAQLLDASNYLNHYYLVVLLTGLLCVVPAAAAYSLDVDSGRQANTSEVPAWCIHVFVVQLALVYCFAGLAKINADWLLRAMPLAVWLPEHSHWPIVGNLMAQPMTAFAASWLGMVYDCTIVVWLLSKRYRGFAYAAVIIFHGCTGLLFNIGLFPVIMIGATLVFFPPQVHARVWLRITRQLTHVLTVLVPRQLAARNIQPSSMIKPSSLAFNYCQSNTRGEEYSVSATLSSSTVSGHRYDSVARTTRVAVLGYLMIQLVLPLRAYAYPGQTAWTEEGYRFGWRVMLVEKAGTATFVVQNQGSSTCELVELTDYYTPYQIKQLSIQPDFMLQAAHVIAENYEQKRGFAQAEVYVDARVCMNGRRSRPLIDPSVDLASIEDGLSPKPFILP